MKNILKLMPVAILVLLSIIACDNSQKHSAEAVLKITLNGGEGTQVVLLNSNPFVLASDTLIADANGVIVITKDIESSAYFELVFEGNKTRFPIFIIPGDTLFMSANLEQFYETLQFSGIGSVNNNYIAEYTRSSNQFQQEVFSNFSQPEHHAVRIMDSLREVNEKSLKILKENNSGLDNHFQQTEEARVLYEWALLRNIYPMYFRYLNKTEDFNVSAAYKSYLGELNINDSMLLSLGIYQSFLDTYIGVEMEHYYQDDSLQKENPSVIQYRLNLIDNLFIDSNVKELMAFKAVMDFIRYDGIKDYDIYFADFEKICSNPDFLELVNSTLEDWKHLKKGEPGYSFQFESIEGGLVSMNEFKGKYVYVDVWATWCNPCRQEIPFLKELEKEFHGQDIVFVSISVDQTQDPWKAMVASDTLSGVQLWAGQDLEFKDFYKITGIPRFMLFDNEGNIIESSANRPSQDIAEVLYALLND